jgi:hypothetical protein
MIGARGGAFGGSVENQGTDGTTAEPKAIQEAPREVPDTGTAFEGSHPGGIACCNSLYIHKMCRRFASAHPWNLADSSGLNVKNHHILAAYMGYKRNDPTQTENGIEFVFVRNVRICWLCRTALVDDMNSPEEYTAKLDARFPGENDRRDCSFHFRSTGASGTD